MIQIVELESFAAARRAARACRNEADRIGWTRKQIRFAIRGTRRYGKDAVALTAIVHGIAIAPAHWKRIALAA